MFDKVKFGDAFKTECGKKAIYWYKTVNGNNVLVTDDANIVVDNEGKAVKVLKVFAKGVKLFKLVKKHDCNIVGKWIED